jgi:CRP/FNR family transcriptional regulator, cyclic AMP receptor protein
MSARAVEALARTTIFGGLPRAELAALAARLATRQHPRGAFVWNEGDPGDGLYILVSGRVHVFRTDEEGNEVVIHVWLPGFTDGEPALFAPDRVRLTQARAVEASQCLYFEREDLLGYLERQPIAMRGMLTRLSVLARQQTAQLSQIAHHDIAGRLVRRLLDLAAASGETLGRAVRITVPLSQRTLAGLVAASRENVNRALARLAADGLVRVDDGHLVLLDPERLRRRVG